MHSFASRITQRIMLWITVIMLLMSAATVWFFTLMANELYGNTFRNSLYTTDEYTIRVFSDVEVAVNNHIKSIEMTIDRPDRLKVVLAGLVRDNHRIRSVGVSFVENYYPQKGRLFCPYAWRNDAGIVQYTVLGNKDNDYLQSEWFRSTIESNTTSWGEPFLDGHQSSTQLIAYLVPIHDGEGNVVAVLGADLALDWLSDKLREADSLTIANSLFTNGENPMNNVLYSIIIDRDGTYISHPRKDYVLTNNFYRHVTHEHKAVVDSICGAIATGKSSMGEILTQENLIIDGREGYLFFRPMQYKNWMIATFVDTEIISRPAIIIGVIMAFIIGITLLIIQIVSRLAAKHVTQPLRQLALSVEEVAKGNFDTTLPQVKKNDEVKLLHDSVENMQQSLTKYIEELKESTAQQSAMENELKIAHDIQASLLPKTFPPFPDRSDVDLYGTQTPAKAVGGDLFDFSLHNNKLFFCIGDVSGKGVPASLFMAVTQTLFRTIAAHQDRPELVTKALNRALSHNNANSMFVTFFMGVLHLDSGLLEYCNAGHESPLLINKSTSYLPVESNLPLGIDAEWNYTAQQTTLTHGTTIFLYTDGLNEAENADHTQFGRERAIDAIRRYIDAGCNKPQQLVEQLTAAIHFFVGDAEQSDDLTMLAVRLN